MFFKSIPFEMMQKLKVPLQSVTYESVTERLNSVFGKSNWKSECTHKQLFAVSVPLVGPRGMEVQTSITFWLTKNTIVVPVGKGEYSPRTSYIVGPFIGDDDRSETEKLAFLNTACRIIGLGSEDKTQILSIESGLLGRKMFMSDMISDFVVDEQAIKVILEKQEEQKAISKDRRNAERTEVTSLDSIPATVQVDRAETAIDFFLLDFSSSGLKIVASYNFPQDRQFNFTIKLSEPITLLCEVVWKSEMWNNNYYVGLKFTRLQLDKFEKLCRNIESYIPAKIEEAININKVIAAEFGLWRDSKKLPVFIHSISSRSLSVIFPAFLQVGKEISVKLFPFKENIPIECQVLIESSRVLKNGGSQAILKIADMSDGDREKLESYIRYCIMEERRSKQDFAR